MSNFGADIFDEEPSSPSHAEPRLRKPAPPPVDPAGGEVSLSSGAAATPAPGPADLRPNRPEATLYLVGVQHLRHSRISMPS